MATLAIRDADNALRYLDVEGTGTELDPFQPRHRVIGQVLDAFFTAQVTVATAGAIVQLPAFPLRAGVWMKALSSNSGNIYVGNSAVSSTTGFELDKQESVLLPIDELSKLYITASANAEGVCLIGI